MYEYLTFINTYVYVRFFMTPILICTFKL